MSFQERIQITVFNYLKQYPVRGFHSKKYRQRLKAIRQIYCIVQYAIEQELKKDSGV